MALIKRRSGDGELISPFRSVISDFFENTDRLFSPDLLGGRMLTRIPAANIVEEDDSYLIQLAAPGLKKKDFQIEVQDGVLFINVENEEETEEEETYYTRREYSYNAFSRSFNLPESVKSDDIEAEYEDGILRVLLPKKAEAKRRMRKEIEVA